MTKKIIEHAITTLITLSVAQTGFAASAHHDMADTMANIPGMEKCYSIAKAHHNDCGNDQHSCSGESKIDGDKRAYILLPVGYCSKIVGGSLKAPDKA
jgi:uncharacterized membrane protein